MKKIIIILLISAIAQNIYAQSPIEGVWEGILKSGLNNFSITFRIKESNNKLDVSMDIPQQMLLNFKHVKAEYTNDSLFISINSFNAKYNSAHKNDSLYGFWQQNGISLPLNMKKTSEYKALEINRPQNPQPPFPYITEEVSFFNKKAKINLSGTLTIPDTTDVWPCVVLVSGSGAQNRDEEIAMHRPFAVIADYFSRNGIAVLRYDDRGTAKSKGNFATATTLDLSGDAASAVEYVKKHPYINKKNIGIVGHSEGGIIAVMQAAKNKSLNFIISMAGVAIPCTQLLVIQNDKILEGYGANDDLRDFFWNFNTAFYNLVLTEPDLENLKTEAYKLLEETSASLTEKQKKEFGLSKTFVNQMLIAASSPWMKYFLSIVPSEYIKKIKINALAINGSKDTQVPAEANIEAFKSYFINYKGKKNDTHIFKNLNHLFQPCKTGMPDEYAMIETTISPEVLEYMCKWIKSLEK
ncbi:MAG: prolyl oligopeptidase family serine peptidase [Bacteroidales bacterium]|jgi:dienelactone hydrolase|nr:prolyl oligopeptidase family serine peptidase [Bacteroidales bacterium]